MLWGAARAALGGGMGGMPSMGGFGGSAAVPGMSVLSSLPATLTSPRGRGGMHRGPGELDTAVLGGPAAEQAVAFAKSKIGKPYVWGAVGPNAYDCSGLVMDAYKHAGISLPHHTSSKCASVPRSVAAISKPATASTATSPVPTAQST